MTPELESEIRVALRAHKAQTDWWHGISEEEPDALTESMADILVTNAADWIRILLEEVDRLRSETNASNK